MFKEFKEFALKGNVVDMAVGIILGVAFGAIIKSLVDDLLMPPLGLILGSADFTNLFLIVKEGATPGPFATLADAHKAGAVTINYGLFINTIVNFLIVAFALFLVIRNMNEIRRRTEKPAAEAAPTTKECPYCLSSIAIKATRCPNCTSELKSS
ncbi:large conductance mechanosensitive channel [Syntrophus gentianae]|uniref:Large-conductance mechanosensitive channel n=1 Tax=Syntrophus gentianae TaxID=43775 RepID=A0A1H7ZLW3_9BACT|nr:large conductance mechanosensitive channel protein MscL [Syntrophus gentianae]SEM58538.1 large conductance mechanosensitive channel [Syntrophus gentianae]